MKLRLTLENTSDLPATAPASIEFGDRESLSIGRAQGLDWTLPDPSQLMSGRHCEIRRSPEGYLLYDLSTNGTFIDASNTRLTSPHALQDGERLLIGAYLIRVEVTDDGEPASHDEQTRMLLRPAAEPLLRLTIENQATPADQQPLTKTLGREGLLRIGRDDSADWTLADRSGGISRNHCMIRCVDGAFVVQDTSSNGTFVNDGSERIRGSHTLRDGDRLLIGPYLITARITGIVNAAAIGATGPGIDQPAVLSAAAEPPPAPVAAVRPAGAARRGGDPALLLADLPPVAPAPGGHGADTTPERVAAASDGMTRLARVVKTPLPTPSTDPAATMAVPEAAVAVSSSSPAAADAPPPAPPPDRVLAGMARGLGLSPEDLDETDAAALGERLGQLILLITEEMRQWLALRNAAIDQPPGARAGPSNPLSIMPSSEEALRVLFGPPRRAYLDSHQSFQTCLAELGQHFRQTDAAVRAAAQVLANELAPEAIDRAVSAENRIGQLLGSRKARLWDIYVERWGSRKPLQPHRPVRSFLEAFAGETIRSEQREDH